MQITPTTKLRIEAYIVSSNKTHRFYVIEGVDAKMAESKILQK